jgi:hypothetical protein
LIWVKREAKYFREGDWTGRNRLKRFNKSVFSGNPPSAVNLKFLSVLLQPNHRNFKFKTRTRKHQVASAPYDSEVRIRRRRDSLRTSESEH